MVGRNNGLRQEDYIYGLEWDANVVTLFCEVLADQARMGKFSVGGNNKHAIQTAQYMVNKFFNKSFEFKECLKQVRLLRQRHTTFGKMMVRDDVGWDASQYNSMGCTDETWADIVNEDPFAWAYAQNGDPNWDDLQVMFGPPRDPNSAPPQANANNEVIVIDDDCPQPNIAQKFVPLNEVISISSDKSGSLSTNFWNELGTLQNESDEEGSFHSPSLKTEMSSTHPSTRAKGKEKKNLDNVCIGLYGKSYVSSSSHVSPNGKI